VTLPSRRCAAWHEGHEDELIDTVWTQAESRNDKEQAELLAIRVGQLGVSEEQAQAEMGYDTDDIAAFKRDKLRRQAMALRQAASQPAQTENQNMTQTENQNGATSEPAAA
jgi:hypothetical protein